MYCLNSARLGFERLCMSRNVVHGAVNWGLEGDYNTQVSLKSVTQEKRGCEGYAHAKVEVLTNAVKVVADYGYVGYEAGILCNCLKYLKHLVAGAGIT